MTFDVLWIGWSENDSDGKEILKDIHDIHCHHMR